MHQLWQVTFENKITHTLFGSDSPREELIRNEIAYQIAPRELPSSSRVCHNCWRRTDRAVSQSTAEREPSELSSLSTLQSEVSNVLHPEQQSLDNTTHSILLPNYVRAPLTQNQCFFPGCNDFNRLTVPSALRVRLFCDYNYYVPPECRICNYHLNSNSWDLLLESIYNPIKTFSAAHIEDFATLLKDNMNHHIDFENIHSMPEHTVHYYLGLSKAQYEQILSEVPRLSSKHRGSFALAAYLMKLRTGDSDERMSALLQVPRSTLERLMNMTREILNQDFVPLNVGINHISRAEIAQRNLLIPNGIYGGEDRRPIIIADGTYIYIEKSSNYLYQKKTYSLHKYRNLIKPFLFVCSDGYIIDILGPYHATTSDADIINNEFIYESSSLRQYFESGDVFILDRGFRDSLPLLERCGYQVHVPLSPADGESQLTTRDANKSRAVTMCRWVVEVVNGIFKSPVLTYSDLILIACGTYQLKQARSYYGEHIRFNGSYRIEVCNDHRSSIMEGINLSPSCSLLRARIASRHISRKIYFIYILISGNDTGRSAIKKYCCNCIVGRRTVGCCAHVMTVIWYLGWARHQTNILPHAQFLDDILIVYGTNDI
ncbi:unnamed protein product [Parnassius mnemosyne]|uniref:DDE Tnp4 domain-containing protein n=1 Tax=Parnassius mnemosyne TaxID=213953 RepID=A0AAV1KXA7_9NEOP